MSQINLNSQLVRTISEPLDKQLFFETLQQALDVSLYDHVFYKQCVITVYNDTEENNGLWKLNDLALYSSASSWDKIATLNDSLSPDAIKYINTGIPPVTMGGYKNDEPATPEEGLTLQEAIDKFLFPYIEPTISFNTSSNQSQWKQDEFTITIDWNIQHNTSGASTSTLTLFSKKNTEGEFTEVVLTSPSDTDSISFLSSGNANVDFIDFKLILTDSTNKTIETTARLNMTSYLSPNVTFNRSTASNVEIGTPVTFTPEVVARSTNATFTNALLRYNYGAGNINAQNTTLSNVTSFIFDAYTLNPDASDSNVHTNVVVEIRITDIHTTSNYNTSVNFKHKYFIGSQATVPNSSEARSFDQGFVEDNENGSGKIENSVAVTSNFVFFIVPMSKQLTYLFSTNNENTLPNANESTIAMSVGGGNTVTYRLYTVEYQTVPGSLSLNYEIT